MAQCVYVTSAGPGSGKGVIALGLMELLSGAVGRVGFFRPVLRDPAADRVLALIASRYDLGHPVAMLHATDVATARTLVAEGRFTELHTRVLERYRAIEADRDFVLCLGSDFDSLAPALELDFNLEIARHLGAVVLPVLDGRGKAPTDLVDGVRALLEVLAEHRLDAVGLVVNRVRPDEAAPVEAGLRQRLGTTVPIFVVPEHPLLGMPTVGEIAGALGARRLSGEGGDREVACYKVAAMELPHFLDHLEDGSLVITPGDRSDIILGSLLADAATTYPRVAGLVLSGGLDPAPQVRRLLDGLLRSPVPVLGVDTDTFDTAMAVSAVEGHVGAENPRKIAAAIGLVEARLDRQVLGERLAMPRPSRVTPLMFEYELIQRARRERRHIVLPEGTDERVLRAAEVLRFRDVADLTLLGDAGEVRHLVARLGLQLEGVAVVDPARSESRARYAETYHRLRQHKGISPQMAYDAVADLSYFGTLMVYHGDADGMVSGAVHTTQETIRPAFEVVRTEPGVRIASSVFFMCLADRVLVYGDCAVNPNPTAEDLADIALSSAATAERFGVTPRVAMLSYSTGDSGRGREVEKVREATRLVRVRRPELKVEGPIQYDAAVDAAVARTKLPGSEVAGQATVFVFPDLNTGNNTYKAVQRSAGAVAIGPVIQGLNRPVNDLSRGCTVTDIVNTVAITAIQAQGTAAPL
jgi:phosphate acetyltransferase